MFQPAARINRGREVTKAYKIPASVKGWHRNEPVTDMDEEAAVQLDNFYPEPGALRLRYGYQQWATLEGAAGKPVDTLMVYLSGATQKVFAAANNHIFDVTAGGSDAPGTTGINGDKFQWTNFATPAGQFLVAVNGVDTPVYAYGPTGAPPPNDYGWQGNGLMGPTNPLANVWEFMGTLFFAEQGTDILWFLPVNQISGTAQSIPMGSLFNKGGYVMAGGEWTYSTGYSILNLCVVVSSEGECVVYSGTDPASSSTWSKVGQFTIGRPIGRRCVIEINSDMVVMCEDGLMPMSKAIQYDRAAAAQGAFTWNIQKAFADAYQAYNTNFGWQILSYAWGHMAIINVPIGTEAPLPAWPGGSGPISGGNMQFVMDVLTGAWCRYLGLDAISWVVQEDTIFFGDQNGVVWQAETGSADRASGPGGAGAPQPISGSWVSAYNDLRAPGRYKSARALRVVFQSDAPFQSWVGTAIDYDYVSPQAQPISHIPGVSYWDSALWDAAIWGYQTTTQASWVNAIGDGYQLAVTTVVSAQSVPAEQPIHVYITDAYLLHETGAWLG